MGSAMLVLSGLLMMMMRSEAAEVVTARSGETVLLSSEELKGAELKLRRDIRWTHQQVVLSSEKNKTRCHHGRCTMRGDGALRFAHVQPEDAGNYSVQVFDAKGVRLMKKDFLLKVVEAGPSHGTRVSVSLVLLLLVLLVLFMVFFFLRRRRGQSTTSKGPMEDNIYVVMHGNHGNKKNMEEKKQDKEEESPYVAYMGAPITEQRPTEEEDVYV